MKVETGLPLCTVLYLDCIRYDSLTQVNFRIGLFWAVWQNRAILRPNFWTEVAIFLQQGMGTQNVNFTKDCYTST